MNYAKHRRELVVAVWAAEFTRALGGTAQSEPTSAAILRRLAERAADSADRAVEALRLFIDVEFRLASGGELDDCYMTWEKFVAACRGGALTDDDGHGELATDEHYISSLRVHPSKALRNDYPRPDWATHVCWYNK